MGRNGTNISDWLIESCHIDDVKAKYFEDQVKETCWSTGTVENLQAMLLKFPQLLDSIDSIEAPVWVKQFLKDNISSFNKSLESPQSLLPVHQEQHMLQTSTSSSGDLQTSATVMIAEHESVPDFGEDGDNTGQVSSSSANDIVSNDLEQRHSTEERCSAVTISETSSPQQPATTNRASKAQRGRKELAALSIDIDINHHPTTSKPLRSSMSTQPIATVSSSRYRPVSSGSSRPVRAATLYKTNFYVPESRVSSRERRTKRVRPQEEDGEDVDDEQEEDYDDEEEIVEQPKKKRSRRTEGVLLPVSVEQSSERPSRADRELVLHIKAQATIIKTSLDMKKRIKAVIVLSDLAADETNPGNAMLIQRSDAYKTMLEILSTNGDGDDDLLWKTMIALNNTTAHCDTSVVHHLVEGGVVLLALPLCHSICTKLRLQALWMIGNLGASECKSEVTTRDVVKTIAESYPSSESLVPFQKESMTYRYAITLQILTKDCSQHQARMMIPFIPVLKCILKIENLVGGIEYVCAALENLLCSKENMIVNEMFKVDILSTLLQRLSDNKSKIIQSVLDVLINLADSCNCEQILLLQPALVPLHSMIQNCDEVCANEKSTILAIECIGSIAKRGVEAVSMMMRTSHGIFGFLVHLVQEGLKAMKFPGSRADTPAANRTIYAASALMQALHSAAAREDLQYFIVLGCYPLVFAVLQAFSDDETVQDILHALSNMIDKLQYGDLLQREAVKFDASAGWAVVRSLAGKHTERNSARTYSAQMLENSVYAQQLLQTAIQLRLTNK